MPTIDTITKELAEKMTVPRAAVQGVAPEISGYPPTVTPYLPRDAIIAAQAHERTGHPVFVKAYERADNELACPNCQGVGFIVLNLAKAGPFKSPPPTGVITWFDGNERYRAGWYVIAETLQYDCPECHRG